MTSGGSGLRSGRAPLGERQRSGTVAIHGGTCVSRCDSVCLTGHDDAHTRVEEVNDGYRVQRSDVALTPS